MESRDHKITKVFANDTEGLDLLLLGYIDQQAKDGTWNKGIGFVARMLFDRSGSSGVRVKHYQAAGFAQ